MTSPTQHTFYSPKKSPTSRQDYPYSPKSPESTTSRTSQGADFAGEVETNANPDEDDDSQRPMPFLMVEDPLRPASREHRRTVRHHVMRAVHSRRRAQNRTTAKKQTLMQKQSPTSTESMPELAYNAYTEGSPNTGVPRNSASRHHTEEVEAEMSTQSSTSPAYSPNQVNQPVTTNSSAFPTNTQNSTIEDPQFFSTACFIRPLDQWTFDTTTPYAILQLDGAPTLSMQSSNWPFASPSSSPSLSPKVSIWMPSRIIPIPNHRSPRDILHTSPDVLPYIVNSEEYIAFKFETIKWINSRLTHSVLGTSDTTIGSILLLVSFEIARGNVAESNQHMNGLERIVNLRGGISCFGNNKHFLIKVLTIDLIVSALSNTPPRFDPPNTLSPIPPNILGIRLNRVSDSPLSKSRRIQTVLRGSPFCSRSIDILQRMQDLTTNPESRTCILPPLPLTPDDPNSLVHTIYLAATMYISLIQPPRSPAHTQTQTHCEALSKSLSLPANDKTWSLYPGIYLWILLTASTASITPWPDTNPSHSYFVSLLMNVGLGAGYGWFEELREAMDVFAKMRNRAMSEG
ncbi:hypothetical protein VTL71DRAFT_257 [Oculimacula yallundae]|uniref:Tachykinin family protein n=1 Tax=Oculimacula yallundae TaxID=86028 RepID=A0ABR4CZI4_9HELO